jgi:hypothetical protein
MANPISLDLKLGQGRQNTVIITYYYDDPRRKPPFYRGPGYIEIIRYGTVRTIPMD